MRVSICKAFLFLSIWLIVPPPSFAQTPTPSYKPQALMLPVNSLSGVSELQARLMWQQSHSFLSAEFYLVSLEQTQRLQSQHSKLFSEVCDTSACFEKITDSLHIPMVIQISTLKNKQVWEVQVAAFHQGELYLSDATCESCKLRDISQQLEELLQEMVVWKNTPSQDYDWSYDHILQALQKKNLEDSDAAARSLKGIKKHGLSSYLQHFPPNPEAAYKLGLLFRKGYQVQSNAAYAAAWYQLAAQYGHAKAQNNLGFLYAQGHGVPKILWQAHFWYETAAVQGNNAQAFYNLGALFHNGVGTPRNSQKALEFYQEAATRGNRMAQKVFHFLKKQQE